MRLICYAIDVSLHGALYGFIIVVRRETLDRRKYENLIYTLVHP